MMSFQNYYRKQRITHEVKYTLIGHNMRLNKELSKINLYILHYFVGPLAMKNGSP